jgi:hypothetical protein
MQLLVKSGVEIGHEQVYMGGIIGWPVLFREHPLFAEVYNAGMPLVLYHQVREPKACIASMAGMFSRGDWPPLHGQEPVERLLGWEPEDSALLRAMRMYRDWNIRKRPGEWIRYRVEDLVPGSDTWAMIAQQLEITTPIPVMPCDHNTHKDMGGYPDLSWNLMAAEDMEMAGDIMELAKEYGYEDAGAMVTVPDVEHITPRILEVTSTRNIIHDDFFLRAYKPLLVSPTMRAGIAKMSAHREFLPLPVEEWRMDASISVRKSDVAVVDYESLDPFPGTSFIHFLSSMGKDLVGAEIGVEEGRNANNLLSLLSLKTLYLIDPYTDNEEYLGRSQNIEANLVAAEPVARAKLEPYADKIIWIRKRAVDAIADIEEDSLDFVYSDGDKIYNNIALELILYISKLKVGGVLGGHDYVNTVDGQDYPVNETKTAVDEFVIATGASPLYHANSYLQWWIIVTEEIKRVAESLVEGALSK